MAGNSGNVNISNDETDKDERFYEHAATLISYY